MRRSIKYAATMTTLAVMLGSNTTVLGQSVDPVTLRFAVEDTGDEIGHPYINTFIEKVSELSDGSIIIEPDYDDDGWNAEEAPILDLEEVRARPFGNEEVLDRIVHQEAELGLVRVSSLGWDTLGVSSLQALAAPYLIDELGLEFAVTRGDIATRAMSGLVDAGLTGLALLPQDLFHPFSWVPDQPLLSPDDYAGATIRALPSVEGWGLIEALGATPWIMDSFGGHEPDGTIEGMEVSLRSYGALIGEPTATGNVTPQARINALVIATGAFERLDPSQQQALIDAAVATREAVIAMHPTEADLAAEWCAQGHSVVLASPEQLEAFEAAAQPVMAAIEADPLSAELIADIRALKESVEPLPAAGACGPVSIAAQPPVDRTGFLGTLVPNGTYRTDVTVEMMVAAGADAGWATRNAGIVTWSFTDGALTLTTPDGESCMGTAVSVDGVVRLDTDQSQPCGLGSEIMWRPVGDDVEFLLVDVPPDEEDGPDFAAWLNRVWTRIE